MLWSLNAGTLTDIPHPLLPILYSIAMLRNVLMCGVSAGVGMAIGVTQSEAIRVSMNVLRRGAEGDASVVSSPQRLMDKAVGLAKEAGPFAVLSTTSASGGSAAPKSRVIVADGIAVEGGGPVIYFNTNRLSRKLKELEANDRVTLTYLHPKTLGYVNFEGVAERVPYPESAKHWADHLYLHYPEGPDESKGSRFTLWRIKPDRIQCVCILEGLQSVRDDWRPPELELSKDKQWQIACDGR